MIEEGDEENPVYKYLAYFFSKEKDKSLSYEFLVACHGQEKYMLENEKELSEQLLHSIIIIE